MKCKSCSKNIKYHKLLRGIECDSCERKRLKKELKNIMPVSWDDVLVVEYDDRLIFPEYA